MTFRIGVRPITAVGFAFNSAFLVEPEVNTNFFARMRGWALKIG